jgi:hypothetical protein
VGLKGALIATPVTVEALTTKVMIRRLALDE